MAKLGSYIWFEKYRPQTLKDLSLNKEHRVAFKAYVKDKQIPHLLLEGPAGSGKTTISHILMNHIPSSVLMLNASGKEDRSIDTMQTRVKTFAGSQAKKGKLKIVFMDEADGMLGPAQESLKNLMETYNKNCRFILTCNYVDKIIDPIQSRCTRFTFDRFPKRKLVNVCEKILEQEEIDGVSREDINNLINRFYPDMRSIINNLQSACVGGSFNPKAIGSLQVDPEEVTKHIRDGAILSIRQKVAGITNFAFMYKYLFDEFLFSHGSDAEKSEMALAIAESCRYDNTVPDREIEFVGCCINIMGSLGVTPNFNK